MNKLPKFDFPYYTALFIITYSDNKEGLAEMDERMFTLIREQEGFLADLFWQIKDESVKDESVIVMCYWKDLESIKNWRKNLEHQFAIKNGQEKWFKNYQIQISKVEYVLGS